MAIKKEYSKNKANCKVTFIVSKEIADNFQKFSLVGDFNDWSPDANIFSEMEIDGSYSATIVLESKKEYEFRYLVDGIHWFNESEADREVQSYYQGSKNSVVVV